MMIRVNLLGTKEPAAGATYIDPGVVGGGEPSEKQGAIIAIAVLGIAVGFIAFQWIQANRTLANLDEEIEQLNQEKARLQPIIVQVEEFKAKLAELEEKERLIERLKSEREGPVRMLDALSGELPDFVWLTELSQNGSNVTIDGMAASYVSIADYIRKLEDNEWFNNVELVDARVDQRGEQEFTEFQLRTQVMAPNMGGPNGQQPAGAASTAGSR